MIKLLLKLFSNRKSLSVITALLLSTTAYSQQKFSISGTVKDGSDNTPLTGVTITIKGTSAGTQSDKDGKFTITINSGNVISFSFLGYKTQEIHPLKSGNLGISLSSFTSNLNEVVVVGYGQQSRSTLAGSTSQVKASQFKEAVITTLDQAIQGRAAGVQIVQTSGEPGADVVFRIRGNNSLSGNNQPLIVVDGIPQPTYVEGNATGVYGSFTQNGTFGINPNDIANIEILKDASATAIYGSRGANGVVLITTKTGKAGESKISFVDKTSYGKLAKSFQMMTGKQYAEIRNSYDQLNGNPIEFGLDTINTSTNWFDAITRSTVRQDYNLSVSGGSPKSTYYISAGYLSDQGVLIGSNNKKGSLTANLNNTVNSWYSNKLNITLTQQFTNRGISASRAFPSNDGPVLDAARATPFFSLNYKGADGGGRGFTSTPFDNPYTDLTKKTDLLKNNFVNANFINDFTLLKDLQLVVTLGATDVSSKRELFFPPDVGNGIVTNGQGSVGFATTLAYNTNAYINYTKAFKSGHQINATFGGEYNLNKVELLNTAASGFDIPIFGVNNLGSAQQQSIGSYKEQRLIESGFLRTNYSYKNKYIFNGSVRLDGASPFATNKKFGWFPSVGIAYNVMEEDFMKNTPSLSNLKLHASYGVTGSQAISPYSSLDNYQSAFYQIGVPGTIVTSVYPSTLPNAKLTWESTSQLDFGLEVGAFTNRINISADYYNKITSNLLQPRSLPSQSGFTTIIDNYGKIGNKGFEITISADIIRNNNLKFTSSLNLSRNINKLINLGTRTDNQYTSLGGNLQGGISNVLTPGQPIGQFYGYQVIGLAQKSDFVNGVNGAPKYPYIGNPSDQVAGGWKYADLNNDGKIDINDRKVLGNATPKFIGGWSNDITYKKFNLNFLFTASYGNQLLDLTRFYLTNGQINNSGIAFNQTEEWYNKHWTAANPTTNVLFPGIQRNIGTQDINSTLIEDGSYIRLKNLSFSYTFDSFKNILKNPKIFFTATNLFTITKYKGLDPEVSSYGQSLLQQGIDYGSYPVVKTYTVGIELNF
jgi:TonB-linked SusC/RagA family outer membrane protein